MAHPPEPPRPAFFLISLLKHMMWVLIRGTSNEYHNRWFPAEIRILIGYPFLSGAMGYTHADLHGHIIKFLSESWGMDLSLKVLLWCDSTPTDWLCWRLMTHHLLCRLPEKGRKEIEEIVEEMKEGGREERGTGTRPVARQDSSPDIMRS